MDNLVNAIDSQTIVLIAAIAVAFLLVKLIFRVLNAGIGLVLAIAAIVLALQYFLGISPRQLWFEISHLPQDILRWVQILMQNIS